MGVRLRLVKRPFTLNWPPSDFTLQSRRNVMSAGLPKKDLAGIPAGIPPKPDPKNFLPPVAWLFGRQLLANIKWFALYAAFKGKLDPRDWMKPNIIRANQSDKPLDESGSPKEAAED